jgi:hypothetical protein
MLRQFHHAYPKHFYFTTQTSHGTSYFNFLSSSIGHASRSGKIGLIEEKLQNLEIPLLLGGHSIGSFLSMEMIKKSPEKLKHCVKLYPFLAFNSHSATQLVINANMVIKSQTVIVSFSYLGTSPCYLVTSPGLLPSEALSLVIMESGSANAVEVAYCSLPQYHVRSGVFYMAIFEFQRISKTPEGITMREREDPQFLSSCVKNMLTHVLTLLDIPSHGCSWFSMGNFNFLSTVMGYMADHYAAANREVALKISFSYSPKFANEIMISCRKRIATLNNQNRQSEVTTPMSTLQFENCTMKGIVNDGVSMFMEIAEETMLDILNVANEFILVSIFNVFDIWSDVLLTVLVEMHVKQGHISCAHRVVVWKALIGRYGKKGECEYAFEIISLYSLVLTKQWNPGKLNVWMLVAAMNFAGELSSFLMGMVFIVLQNHMILLCGIQ